MAVFPQLHLEQPRSVEAVRVAIIVPVYQQPGLLLEALDTALAQETDFAYVIVVVNDGCPFDETDQVCHEFAAGNLERMYYLRKRNGGLSAARNSGIDFALAAFPALEGIYILDAEFCRLAAPRRTAGIGPSRPVWRVSATVSFLIL